MVKNGPILEILGPTGTLALRRLILRCLECTTNMTHTKLPRRLMKFHVQVEGVNIRLCSKIIFYLTP